MKAQLHLSGYGDVEYVKHVLRYYVPIENFKISNDEVAELSNAPQYEFPKYVTQVINLVNSNAGGTRPKVVGQMSELVKEFNGKTIDEPDVDGELVYEGPNVSLGYAECRADLAKGDENHGVLHTGDVARRDADGYYYITGRMKRFVKVCSYLNYLMGDSF